MQTVKFTSAFSTYISSVPLDSVVVGDVGTIAASTYGFVISATGMTPRTSAGYATVTLAQNARDLVLRTINVIDATSF